jgi:long-chain acyl-CoA synthetase
VCQGYYKLDEKTAELLEGGWLHSGDAGFIDENGHLVVIDRLSDVMHNRNDEMFSPMFIENKLKFSPFIKEAVVFGDKRDYIAALINIDPIVVGKWAEDRGISFTTFMDLSSKAEVIELVRQEIVKINARVEKPYFKIRRFAVLYKLLDVDDGELTKTGKIRRKFVNERYTDLVDALYDESITKKKVSTSFQYRDGQTTSVETAMGFHTIDEEI